MRPSPRTLSCLKWLLIAVVASSILHYVDNILFFHEYPEPPWINPSMIDAFWLVMTPLAWIGYRLLAKGALYAGSLVLLVYAACNLLTLGHYLYAPMHSISLRINTLILLEAVLACVLVGFVMNLMRLALAPAPRRRE